MTHLQKAPPSSNEVEPQPYPLNTKYWHKRLNHGRRGCYFFFSIFAALTILAVLYQLRPSALHLRAKEAALTN